MSTSDFGELLSVEQAIAILDATAVTPRVVELPLWECQGLHLAQDVVCDRDYPPFDKSLMDGFAVRCADVESPAVLRVVGEIAAGQAASRSLAAGEAMRIMTGAPLPAGADGIVPVEEAEELETGTIRVKPGTPARWMVRQGTEATKGQVVLRAAQRLEAAQIAAAATVGASVLQVIAAPRVGVLATGDEIVPLEQTPAPTKIRNANSPMLMALLRQMGCRAVDLGTVGDRPEAIRRALIKGMQLDALLVSGGMSMGRHDHVPRILRELGVEMKITKLRIKPGKPFVFGAMDRTKLGMGDVNVQGGGGGVCLVFGLPGNPVSGFVCTLRLAGRLLTRLAGGTVRERWAVGGLSRDLPGNEGREFYQPVRLERTGEETVVHPLAWKGSADVFTLTQANGLLVRKENEPALPAGAVVRVMEV